MRELSFDFDSTYESYLDALRRLVSIKSVFTSFPDIRKIVELCQQRMVTALPGWKIFKDDGENLIVVDPHADLSKPLLYLSAHLDTVDADGLTWEETNDPFTVHETDEYLVGRGVNDCKAGVAFMLYVAELIGEGKLPPLNIGFLFSFKEEGNQGKTSSGYAGSIGDVIPLSDEFTCMMALENTVRIQHDPLEIAVYDREPCNMFITVEGDLSEIRDILKRLVEWKPVVISPVGVESDEVRGWEVVDNKGGHICTFENEGNLIHSMIVGGAHDHVRMFSGDPAQTSVVKKEIYVDCNGGPARHRMILNYRGFKSLQEVRSELGDLNYAETFSFDHAAGSDQSDIVQASPVASLFRQLATDDLSVVFQQNPGRSDSSAIWVSLPDELRYGKVILVTCGPGHRSHTDKNGVTRKTHGVNEGFHKPSGRKVLPAFLQFLLQFKR